MVILFTFDEKDYTEDMPLVERIGVRAIIKRNGLYIMQKSSDGEYKIPGGGVEKGENLIDALIREVLEETGLTVIRESIKEIGVIQEIRRDSFDANCKYIAHSYFYFCDVEADCQDTQMTANEIAKGYIPVWEELDTIIANNERVQKEFWTIRDTEFLKWMRNNYE